MYPICESEYRKGDELFIINSTLKHTHMNTEIGQPAILNPSQVYPTVSFTPCVNGRVAGELIFDRTKLVTELPETSMVKDSLMEWTPLGTADLLGTYELRMTLKQDGKAPQYDSYYFTVLDPKSIPAGQSTIAFLGNDGMMMYIGDYRGNRILDFSNAGYRGGGVEIPNIPVKSTVLPLDGDATDRIQVAIDQLAMLPLDKNGFRGAVLLKKADMKSEARCSLKQAGSSFAVKVRTKRALFFMVPERNCEI